MRGAGAEVEKDEFEAILLKEKDVEDELQKGHPRASVVWGLDDIVAGLMLFVVAVVLGVPVCWWLTRVERSAMPTARIQGAASASVAVPRLPVSLSVAVVGSRRGFKAEFEAGSGVWDVEARVGARLKRRVGVCVEGNARVVGVSVVGAEEDAEGSLWEACGLRGAGGGVERCQEAGREWLQGMGARERGTAEEGPPVFAAGAGRYHLVLLVDDSPGGAGGGEDGVKVHVGSGRHGWAVAPRGLVQEGEGQVQDLGAWVEVASELYLCSVVDCGEHGAKGRGAGLPLSSKYTAMVSLLNPEPLSYAYDWAIEDATRRWLDPMAERLRHVVADVEFQSQMVNYASMGATPSRASQNVSAEKEDAYRPWVVTHQELGYFVDQSEWGLDTSSRLDTPLHLAVYVSGATHCPLLLNDTFHSGSDIVAEEGMHVGGAFTVPGWGGVVLLNPPREVCERGGGQRALALGVEQLREVAGTAVAQLRELVGLAGVPRDIHADLGTTALGARWTEATVTFVTAGGYGGMADWEADLLARRRSARYLVSAKNSMVALERVVSRLENLEVLGEIQGAVAEALDLLEDANVMGRGWGKAEDAALVYEAAVSRARRAYDACEAAFYHPAVSSLDHHDADHTVAIYMPFFMPICLMLVQHVKRECMGSPRTKGRQPKVKAE